MTSKDKAVVSLPVSPWDAILQTAKDQLPSLDSDSSLSDYEEEEPFIFQRNQPVLIPDLTEELAEDPIVVDESGTWVTAGRRLSPEPLLVPGRLAIEPRSEWMVRSKDLAHQERRGPGWSCQSCVKSSPILVDAEEAFPWLEGSLRSLSNPRGSQSPSWCSQGEEATFPLEGELKTEPSDPDFRNSAKHKALRRERRKMIERDILHKVTQAAQSPACGDHDQATEVGSRPEATSKQSREGWPVLSLKWVTHDTLQWLQLMRTWRPLQDFLQPCNQCYHFSNLKAGTWITSFRVCRGDKTARATVHPEVHGGHSTGPSQDILLEQLALLCATQSRVHNPPSKVSADKLRNTEERVAGIRSASAEPGFQTERVQKLAESGRLKTEPPTVFIDLRQTEPSRPQEDQSQESSEHSSSDSEEEEVESAGSVQVTSSWEQRYCTGKSQLLQQLRAFRKGAVPSQLPASDSPGHQKAQASEDRAGSQTQRKKHIKLWAEKQNALDLGDLPGTQLRPGMGQL